MKKKIHGKIYQYQSVKGTPHQYRISYSNFGKFSEFNDLIILSKMKHIFMVLRLFQTYFENTNYII